MRQILTINGKPLSDFHAWYDGSEWFRIPEKEVENIQIDGRSGDLTIDKNRFTNISIPFNCYIHEDFKKNYSNLMNYLMSLTGYQRIESSEEPEVYRLGQIKASVEPETGQFIKRGQFVITIDFMPQKWLKSGENEITIDTSETLMNPSYFEAKPTFLVEGTGTITVNDSTMVLSESTGTVTIDCEAEDVYEEDTATNRNSDITLTNNEFPTLASGTNTVAYSGDITSLIVIPKWWKL